MSLWTILLILLLLIILYNMIRYFVRRNNVLTSLTSATQMQTIQAGSLANPKNSTNFTFSIWLYINDWNYKYGELKTVFGRMNSASTTTEASVYGISGTGPSPLVTLNPVANNLDVFMSTFSGSVAAASKNKAPHKCSVPNIPIQKWVNLLISVYGKTMDVYLDGKLVKTCLLSGVPNVNKDANIYITPNGGFSGYTSKMQYFSHAPDPQTAYDIYVQGPGNNIFSNLFTNNYKLQLSLVQNGQVNGTLTI
jgi:hypothetical protein